VYGAQSKAIPVLFVATTTSDGFQAEICSKSVETYSADIHTIRTGMPGRIVFLGSIVSCFTFTLQYEIDRKTKRTLWDSVGPFFRKYGKSSVITKAEKI
jgi:hypothetical protein